MIVRAYHGDAFALHLFLRSVGKFWPRAFFRSRVLVVLDAESPADQQLCTELPAFVTCVLEEETPLLRERRQSWAAM